MGMPASFRAHSGKNGIRVPSATLATKNRNEPTRAARGAAENAVIEDVRNLKMRVTSKLRAPEGLRLHQACGHQSGALADVNAYGAGGPAQPQGVGQDTARCKLPESGRHG